MNTIENITTNFKEYDYMIFNAINLVENIIHASKDRLVGNLFAKETLACVKNIYSDAIADFRSVKQDEVYKKDIEAYRKVCKALDSIIEALDAGFPTSNEIERVFERAFEN